MAHFLSKEDKDKFSEIAHGINVKKKAIVQKKVGNNEITKNIKINSINEKIEKSKFCSNENKPTIKKVNSENKIIRNLSSNNNKEKEYIINKIPSLDNINNKTHNDNLIEDEKK